MFTTVQHFPGSYRLTGSGAARVTDGHVPGVVALLAGEEPRCGTDARIAHQIAPPPAAAINQFHTGVDNGGSTSHAEHPLGQSLLCPPGIHSSQVSLDYRRRSPRLFRLVSFLDSQTGATGDAG